MRRLIPLLFLMLQAGGQSNVLIQNPSFEAGLVANGGTIPGWDIKQALGGGYDVLQWSSAPDGKNVALLAYGTSISQDLGIKPQAGIYTLKFFVANWFYSYIAGYTVTITEGSKQVCGQSGIATGDFTEITLVCPVSNYISLNYKAWSSPGNLVLSVSNSEYWPLLVDDFSLTFTPEN